MDNPEKSLFSSVLTSKEMGAALGDLAETSIDQLLSDGFVKELPIIGVAVKLMQFGNNISAHIFTKKILNFLKEPTKIPLTERRLMLNKISENHKTGVVGEILLLQLDKIDSYTIAYLLGKVFVLLMSEKICYVEFTQYVSILKTLDDYSLLKIKEIYQLTGEVDENDGLDIDSSLGLSLSISGLLQMNIVTRVGWSPPSFVHTVLGRKFYEDFLANS